MTIAFGKAKAFLQKAKLKHRAANTYCLDRLEQHVRHADPGDLSQLNDLLADADGPGRATILNLINEINRKKLVALFESMEWEMEALALGAPEPEAGRGWTLLTPEPHVDNDPVKGGNPEVVPVAPAEQHPKPPGRTL